MPRQWFEAINMCNTQEWIKRELKKLQGNCTANIVYKILVICIKNKLTTVEGRIMGEYQAGFLKRRSVTGQICTLKEVQEA